jgi:hypothetical protein
MDGPKAQYTFAQVAEVADLPVATLRDWFNSRTGAFALGPADASAPPGGIRYLSARTALAVAIAAALTRLGVPLQRAAQAGVMLAHTEAGHPPRRLQQIIYGASVRTVIAVPPGNSEIKIFPVGGNTKTVEILTKIGETGAVLLPVNPIYDHVRAALDKSLP